MGGVLSPLAGRSNEWRDAPLCVSLPRVNPRFHDKWLEYINGDMTPAQFREWYNKPKHYRVEHPTTNRSHKFEDIET